MECENCGSDRWDYTHNNIAKCHDCGHRWEDRQMDWNVDGHYIAADSADAARREASALYDYDAQDVRPWTDDDQNALDEL